MKMKIDCPAVYTKPDGGEYKHSMLEKWGPAGSQRGNTYKSWVVCVFGAKYPSGRRGKMGFICQIKEIIHKESY